jgi:hypothetical protein
MARTTSATPTPIPASAPGERALEFDEGVTPRPVPVAEAELLDCVTGLKVSAGEEEEVVEPVADEDLVLEDVVVELLVEDVDDEATFWRMLHLTVED